MRGTVFTASPEFDDLWTLRCRHGKVTSDEVVALLPYDEIKECWDSWAARLPGETTDSMVAVVALRELLGRLLSKRYGCSCGTLPWPRHASGGDRPW
jgi:hypothetical protein